MQATKIEMLHKCYVNNTCMYVNKRLADQDLKYFDYPLPLKLDCKLTWAEAAAIALFSSGTLKAQYIS